MDLWLKSLWLLLVQSLCTFTAVENSAILCKETYYVEVGNSALVSCEYDRSFYAVRWYFDGSEISFLRMDGTSKSGSGLANGEFDIESDGSMIITDVQLKHEGTYTISVLDSSGVVSSQDVIVYAMVMLRELKVFDCKSTSTDICVKLTSEQRETTLVCVAENSRPEIELTWTTTLQNMQNVIPSPPNYGVSMDPNSLMHTSSSYIQYDKQSFVIEYFTCVITGIAAQNVNNVSLLLEGIAEFAEHTEDTKYVQRGLSFQVECPKNTFQSALLKVNYPNGLQKVLMTLNPNGRNTQCLNGAKCQGEKDGLVTIDNVSFEDEGTYQCVFSDGTTSYAHDLNVVVVVPPSPAVTVIEGCRDTQTCKKNAPLFGTLRCFLLGSKPTANLFFAVDQSSVNDILIFNIQSQVREAKEVGALDTILTAEYEIRECGNPIQITCKADSQVHNTIKSSTMLLEADVAHCRDGQKSTSIAFVVLFIILLFVLLIAGIAIFIFVRRKRSTYDEGKSKIDGEENEEKVEFLSAKEQNQETVKETNERSKEGKQDKRKGEEHITLLTEHKKSTDVSKEEKITSATGEETIEPTKEQAQNFQPEDKSHGKEDFQELDGEHNIREEGKYQAPEVAKAETNSVYNTSQDEVKLQGKGEVEKDVNDNKGEDKPRKIEDVNKERKIEEVSKESQDLSENDERKPEKSDGKVKTDNKLQIEKELKKDVITEEENYREEGKHQTPEGAKVETFSVNSTTKDEVKLQGKGEVEKDIGDSKVSKESQDRSEKDEEKPKNSDVKAEDKPQIEKELKNDVIPEKHNYQEKVKPQEVKAEKAKTTDVPILTREDKQAGKQDVSKEKKSEEISEETHKPAVKDGGETQTNAGKMEKDELQVHETEKNRTNHMKGSQQGDVAQMEDVTPQNIETKQSSQLGDKCEGEEAKTNNQKSGVKKQYSQREDSHEGKDEAQNKTSDTKKSNSETVEDILKRFEQNTHQPVQNILKYVKFSTVKDTSDTKILYIYFLQVCYRRYHESTKNSRFREIFCAILQKVMADQEEKQRDEPEGEKLTGIFLRVLLCSVERKTIDIDTCMKILLEEMDHNTIQREEYYHAIKNCLQESLLSTKTLTDILFASLENDLITQENFATTLKSQRKAEQMTQEDFLIALKFAVKNKQLSTSKFTNILSESLSKDLISQPTFLTALESLFTTKQISKDIFQSTLFGKLKEKQIPAELFVSNMHSLLAKGQIECMIFVDLLKCSVNDNLMPSEMFTNILYQTLQEKLIREETFVSTLKALLTKNKIGFVLFMDLLERSLNDKLISDKRFENQFKTYLQEGDWNKNRWIQLLIRLLTKHTIKDNLKLQLLKLVTVKYKMSEQDLKKVLQSTEMKAEEIKAFMSGLDF